LRVCSFVFNNFFLALACCLAVAFPVSLAAEGSVADSRAYDAVRQEFLEHLNYADSKGVGVSSFRQHLFAIDKLEASEESRYSKLGYLKSQLESQLNFIESGGCACVGSEILSTLLKESNFGDTLPDFSLEFDLDKASYCKNFKWIRNPDQAENATKVKNIVEHMILNPKSPNQRELPIHCRISVDGLFVNLRVFDQITGKLRYCTSVKYPCIVKEVHSPSSK
jgi:hypothetical protein